MPKESNYTAIILKKQPFGDSDEIITFYSKEAGKLRGLAKSVKSPKSKLQQRLQSLFLVNISLVGSHLPKVIFADPIKTFSNLRQNLAAMKIVFYVIEVVLKFTPDEEANGVLFNLLTDFFDFLDNEQNPAMLNVGLAKFKITFLESLGLGVRYPTESLQGQQAYFSSQGGGFVLARSVDGVPVGPDVLRDFFKLKQTGFADLSNFRTLDLLQSLLAGFITYQLERQIKSEKYLKDEV